MTSDYYLGLGAQQLEKVLHSLERIEDPSQHTLETAAVVIDEDVKEAIRDIAGTDGDMTDISVPDAIVACMKALGQYEKYKEGAGDRAAVSTSMATAMVVGAQLYSDVKPLPNNFPYTDDVTATLHLMDKYPHVFTSYDSELDHPAGAFFRAVTLGSDLMEVTDDWDEADRNRGDGIEFSAERATQIGKELVAVMSPPDLMLILVAADELTPGDSARTTGQIMEDLGQNTFSLVSLYDYDIDDRFAFVDALRGTIKNSEKFQDWLSANNISQRAGLDAYNLRVQRNEVLEQLPGRGDIFKEIAYALNDAILRGVPVEALTIPSVAGGEVYYHPAVTPDQEKYIDRVAAANKQLIDFMAEHRASDPVIAGDKRRPLSGIYSTMRALMPSDSGDFGERAVAVISVLPYVWTSDEFDINRVVDALLGPGSGPESAAQLVADIVDDEIIVAPILAQVFDVPLPERKPVSVAPSTTPAGEEASAWNEAVEVFPLAIVPAPANRPDASSCSPEIALRFLREHYEELLGPEDPQDRVGSPEQWRYRFFAPVYLDRYNEAMTHETLPAGHPPKPRRLSRGQDTTFFPKANFDPDDGEKLGSWLAQAIYTRRGDDAGAEIELAILAANLLVPPTDISNSLFYKLPNDPEPAPASAADRKEFVARFQAGLTAFKEQIPALEAKRLAVEAGTATSVELDEHGEIVIKGEAVDAPRLTVWQIIWEVIREIFSLGGFESRIQEGRIDHGYWLEKSDLIAAELSPRLDELFADDVDRDVVVEHLKTSVADANPDIWKAEVESIADALYRGLKHIHLQRKRQ